MTHTYVGHHEQGGFGWVEVHSGQLAFPLLRAGARRAAGYHWGRAGCDAVELAEAILADALSTTPPAHLVTVFTEDVVARLPLGDFRLEEWQVHSWLAGHRPRTMSADELVEHIGAIAVADPEEESAALRGLLDRCWDATSISQ